MFPALSRPRCKPKLGVLDAVALGENQGPASPGVVVRLRMETLPFRSRRTDC